MSGPWLYDRVKDTSTTTGTGTLTLANSAPTGFRTFGSVLGDADTVYYCIAHQSAAEWETGIGTYTSSGTTLARTTVLSSSNSGSAVNFSAGTKDVFISPMAALFAERQPDVSITTTATATAYRRNVCTGTSADYTVTLPTPSAGMPITVAMDPALTKIVTVDAGSGKTIGHLGQSQKMWAGESLVLVGVNSTTWRIVGGVCRPFSGAAKRTTTIGGNIASSSVVQVPLVTSIDDVSGRVVDTTNGWLVAPRTGKYMLTCGLTLAATDGTSAMGSSVNTQCRMHVGSTGGTMLRNGFCYLGATGYPTMNAAKRASLTAGDAVLLCAFQTSGSAVNVYTAGTEDNSMELAEIPPW